jgi:MFS family permease
MPSATAPPEARRSSRRALLVALGIDNLGSGLFLPLAVVYATRVVGLPLGVAGTVISLGTLAGLIMPPIAGRFVDRIGPRTVVVAAQLLQAAGAMAFFFADGIAMTVIASALLAAGQQTFYSSLFALIADVSESGPKDRPFALVGMVRSSSFGLGALISGLVLVSAGDGGLRIAVVVNALSFVFAATLLAVRVHPAPYPHAPLGTESGSSDAVVRVLTNRPYLALIAITGLMALAADFFLIGIPVFALDEIGTPDWVPGALLAVLTLITSTCGTAAVRLTRRVSRITLMAFGGGAYVVWALMCLATTELPRPVQVPWLVLSTLVISVGQLTFGTRVNALAEAAAPRASRGRHLAAFQYAFTIAGVVSPAVVALFTLAAWAPWVVVAATCLVAIVALRVLSPRLPTGAVDPHGAETLVITST